MANGQTSVGGFDRRFLQAPIGEGQPVETVPGGGASTLGRPALSNTRPPSQNDTDDVKRQQQEFQQMERDAAEAFQSLVLSVSNQLRGGGGPGQFFAILEKELIETARVWKETRRAAGKDTAIVDRRLAAELDRFPKVSVTQVRTKPGEKVDFVQGTERVGGVENPPLSVAVSAGGGLGDPRTGQIQGRLPGKSTAGEKALETITTLSNALTETEKALETKPKDRALLNRRAGLRDKLTDKESVGGLVAPILSKVLAGTPIAQLPAREKEVLGFYQRQGLVDQLIGQILGGQLSGVSAAPSGAAPSVPVAGAQAKPFDLSKLGGKTKQTLEQAADAIKNQNRDTAAVKQMFVSEFNGDPEAFDAFMKARGIKGF